jgi:hypothetical protein
MRTSSPLRHSPACRWYSETVTGRSTVVTLVLLCAACSTSETIEGPAAELRRFTGAHTRVVWVQGDGTDPYALGDNLVLMGFATDDDRGERMIRDERGSYVKPLLSPSGDRIVYSTRPTKPGGPEMFLVNFDGSGFRKLGPGLALTIWRDPADGAEWVYVGLDTKEYDAATVSRFLIDDPARKQLVWNKTLVSSDTFQVSADGRMAAGLFPWPNAAVAGLPNGELKKVGDGCWTAMVAAGSPVCWVFDGAHRNLSLFDTATSRKWMVNINKAPGFGNAEVYHPRWTNHPRFMTLSGPYNQGGANQVRSGGKQSEIWLGRFSEDFTAVEAWQRVTFNDAGDSYPDLWIDKARSPYPARSTVPIGPAAAGDGGTRDTGKTRSQAGRLIVDARVSSAGPVPTPQSIAPYRHALVVSLYDVLNVVEGQYADQKILVAQWAIRDAQVLPEARKTPGARARLILERYDAHPELEGERLIVASDAPDIPLYYELANQPRGSAP